MCKVTGTGTITNEVAALLKEYHTLYDGIVGDNSELLQLTMDSMEDDDIQLTNEQHKLGYEMYNDIGALKEEMVLKIAAQEGIIVNKDNEYTLEGYTKDPGKMSHINGCINCWLHMATCIHCYEMYDEEEVKVMESEGNTYNDGVHVNILNFIVGE